MSLGLELEREASACIQGKVIEEALFHVRMTTTKCE